MGSAGAPLRAATRRYAQPTPSVEDVCFPAHYFSLYGDINDTDLPGVKFDVERVTISVQWKQMLSIFYGEAEYQKWASKVMRQHATGSEERMMKKAISAREACGRSNYRQLRRLSSVVLDRAKKEEDERTCKIRIMRFKRILHRMENRDQIKDVPEDVFRMAGRASFVNSVRYAWDWGREDDEEGHMSNERGCGYFYDGMGMKFDGKGELNELGVISDNEDEWEDESDLDDDPDSF